MFPSGLSARFCAGRAKPQSCDRLGLTPSLSEGLVERPRQAETGLSFYICIKGIIISTSWDHCWVPLRLYLQRAKHNLAQDGFTQPFSKFCPGARPVPELGCMLRPWWGAGSKNPPLEVSAWGPQTDTKAIQPQCGVIETERCKGVSRERIRRQSGHSLEAWCSVNA